MKGLYQLMKIFYIFRLIPKEYTPIVYFISGPCIVLIVTLKLWHSYRKRKKKTKYRSAGRKKLNLQIPGPVYSLIFGGMYCYMLYGILF